MAVNVLAGFTWSPLTSASKVRVVGVGPADLPTVEKALQTIRDEPALRVNSRRVESLVMASEDYRCATFSLNVFGRGVLKVESRKPVAHLKGNAPLFLSEDGDLFMSRRTFGRLPVLYVPVEANNANLSLFAGWESSQLADLCRFLIVQLPNLVWNVEVDPRGDISLRAGSGGRVKLGSADGLERKVGTLRQLLDTQPNLLLRVKELNLSAPSNPVLVPATVTSR